MRKPRDLDRYVPAVNAAAQLQAIAADLERGGGLVKFNLQLSFWQPGWERGEYGGGGVPVRGLSFRQGGGG